MVCVAVTWYGSGLGLGLVIGLSLVCVAVTWYGLGLGLGLGLELGLGLGLVIGLRGGDLGGREDLLDEARRGVALLVPSVSAPGNTAGCG